MLSNHPFTSIENVGGGGIPHPRWTTNTPTSVFIPQHDISVSLPSVSTPSIFPYPRAFDTAAALGNPLQQALPFYQTTVNLQVRTELDPNYYFPPPGCNTLGPQLPAAEWTGNHNSVVSCSANRETAHHTDQQRKHTDENRKPEMPIRSRVPIRPPPIAATDREGAIVSRRGETFSSRSEQDQRKYRERRMKNNEAAKQSRSKRRERENVLRHRVEELEKENQLLRSKLGELHPSWRT